MCFTNDEERIMPRRIRLSVRKQAQAYDRSRHRMNHATQDFSPQTEKGQTVPLPTMGREACHRRSKIPASDY